MNARIQTNVWASVSRRHFSNIFDLPPLEIADSTYANTQRKINGETIKNINYGDVHNTGRCDGLDPYSLFPRELLAEPHKAFGVNEHESSKHVTIPDLYVIDDGSSSCIRSNQNGEEILDGIPSSYRSISISSVGRFQRFKRDDLLEIVPEGLAGELPRDIMLTPSRTKDIGIMYRKATIEILGRMQELEGDPKEIKRCRGWLLEGRRGVGKSSVLNHIVINARRKGWLVIFEPTLSRYAKEVAEIQRSASGIYIQNTFSQNFLERLAVRNRDMLECIPINRSVYGRLSLDGSPLEHTRRLYAPLIDKAVKKELGITEHSNGIYENVVPSLSGKESKNIDKHSFVPEIMTRSSSYLHSIKLPSMCSPGILPPENINNLYDLVTFGMDREAYATQAVYELFEQLKHQVTFPVLIAVDEFNEGFPVSSYVSIRYDNTIFNGYIPSYHLSMIRLFTKFDGHLYKRGIKIYANSWCKRKRRGWKNEILGVKPEEVKNVREFTGREFHSYAAYLRLMNITHKFPEEKLNYFLMLCQGNGFAARRLLTTLY